MSTLLLGVLQGSVLWPILFLLYVADLMQLVKRHQLQPHGYADDTQIYGFCKPTDVHNLMDRISNCFNDVSAWTMANRLQLNPSKTEVLWCASARRLHQLLTTSMQLGNA
jgi:Reverse transcriptase (RNA-dependent DNA polymerase)